MKSWFFDSKVAAKVASDALLTDEEFLRYRDGTGTFYWGLGSPHVDKLSSDFIANKVKEISDGKARVVNDGLEQCRSLRPDIFDPSKFRFMHGVRDLKDGVNCKLREGLSSASQEYFWAVNKETGEEIHLLEVDTAFGNMAFTFTSRVVLPRNDTATFVGMKP